MIKTNNTPCTYEELYYEMWETAGRYSKITRFQVIGSSHDERLIPAVWVGNGNQTVFCIAGMIGTDRYMPGYLVEMIKEYTRAWECGWKLEEIYNLKDLFEKWTICFVPLLNPDGYEIYENDFFAIRNPIYRQMLRMQEVSCKEFTGNARGTELRKNFPTGYYRRKQIHQQPASENETKALVRLFQDDPGRGLLSFGYAGKRIVYFRQSQAFTANQKSYRRALRCETPAGDRFLYKIVPENRIPVGLQVPHLRDGNSFCPARKHCIFADVVPCGMISGSQ